MPVAPRERWQVKRCPVRPISVTETRPTEMAPGLWQGGLGDWAGCSLEFYDLDVVVVLCPTDRNDDGYRVKVEKPKPICIGLLDSKSDLARLDELRVAAVKLAAAVRNGLHVGIFCWQGRNRSGLLMALTLRELHGWSGRQAMEHIQYLRPEALDTESGAFEEHLHKMRPPKWTRY